MNYVNIILQNLLIISILGNILTGVTILLGNIRKVSNIFFFFFSIGLASWAFFLLIHKYNGSILSARMGLMSLSLTVSSLNGFIFTFPRESTIVKRFRSWMILAFTVVFLFNAALALSSENIVSM